MAQAIMVSIDKRNADDYPTWDKLFMAKRLDKIYFVTMTRYYQEYE